MIIIPDKCKKVIFWSLALIWMLITFLFIISYARFVDISIKYQQGSCPIKNKNFIPGNLTFRLISFRNINYDKEFQLTNDVDILIGKTVYHCYATADDILLNLDAEFRFFIAMFSIAVVTLFLVLFATCFFLVKLTRQRTHRLNLEAEDTPGEYNGLLKQSSNVSGIEIGRMEISGSEELIENKVSELRSSIIIMEAATKPKTKTTSYQNNTH